MDLIFKGLADKNRRALLDQLYHNNGQTLGQLCRHLAVSRQAASKHLRVLIRAELVIPLWRGREKVHYLNPGPLQRIAERWIAKYPTVSLSALADLERGLEALKPVPR